MDPKSALAKREDYLKLIDYIKDNFKEMRTKLKDGPFDLDVTDENGKTALIAVIEQRNFTEQMWVLLEYGADPNCRDNEGKTPLHYACGVDRKDMIICLLLFGANKEIADKEGNKPFADYREDLTPITEKIDEIKREFISLTRKRRKFLKYIFDEIDKELGNKLMSIQNLAAYYERINKEKTDDAIKDAQSFISGAKLIKNQYEDSPNLTFEEFIVAISKIAKIHGMKPIDEFIDRYKAIRPKQVMKAAKEEGEGDDEEKKED